MSQLTSMLVVCSIAGFLVLRRLVPWHVSAEVRLKASGDARPSSAGSKVKQLDILPTSDDEREVKQKRAVGIDIRNAEAA